METERKKRSLKYTPLNQDNILGFTKSKLDVRHNNKFMNPYYVNNLIQTDERYQGWTFEDDKDIDGDYVPDSVVYDPQHRPVYFNGYYNRPNDNTMKKKAFYHNPQYKNRNWDNDAYSEYEKNLYEIMLIRTSKDFKPGLKERIKQRSQELGIHDEEDVKVYLKDLSPGFVRDIIHKFIVIPLLISTGRITGVSLDQYAQMINQTLTQKAFYMKDYMALMRVAKKVCSNLTPQEIDNLNQRIRQIVLNHGFTDTLLNSYNIDFDKQTKIKIGFDIANFAQQF